ncbi:deoxyguanosinetriphosphate triphosphohydrolase family protein [Methanoplanus limicola]|uniref:Deoxyguanosinetriphosphate triphosphohydrolase n=1 Tax=Methanoplanus limicola DSM 2279 TaxID=937775 RepID=H1YZ21_9EURY|nr:dNTP triphosphohydrolase [Methanoplanus limicola]EHQ34250.1 deoxyguanosinetriphosphate triphosphohydrolase [Methanoplanus limicola DSM 2279]
MNNRQNIAPEIQSDSAIKESIEKYYSPYATLNSHAVRRKKRYPEDIRTEFSRDCDRIIHSRAYSRYIDKTQVFYLVSNDHITHRALHVQIVSRIGRTIGRRLRLNEDLIEAIATGHDIGHPPYGHTGEKILSELSEKHGSKKFMHNVQSVRFLDLIEDSDLTLQVLDGILCHDGESNQGRLSYSRYSSWEIYDEKLSDAQKDGHKGSHLYPSTPEGCVVRLADTIAYIGRDIQDAIEIGLLPADVSLPDSATEVLGCDNRTIVNSLIMDLIENSRAGNQNSVRVPADRYDEDLNTIGYSDRTAGALRELKEFNYKNIYNNKKLTSQKKKIEFMYEFLFETYLDDLENGNKKSRIYKEYIETDGKNPDYLRNASPPEIVSDYIAGMTDGYFERRFTETVIPKRIIGKF